MPRKMDKGKVSTWEALRAMGLVGPSRLELASDPGLALKVPPSGRVTDACRILKCTRYKLLQALERVPGAREPKLGRPRKELDCTKPEKAWAVHISSLSHQTGVPLQWRCEIFNGRFGKTLSYYQFRNLYRRHSITSKFIRSRLGRPKLKPAGI